MGSGLVGELVNRETSFVEKIVKRDNTNPAINQAKYFLAILDASSNMSRFF